MTPGNLGSQASLNRWPWLSMTMVLPAPTHGPCVSSWSTYCPHCFGATLGLCVLGVHIFPSCPRLTEWWGQAQTSRGIHTIWGVAAMWLWAPQSLLVTITAICLFIPAPLIVVINSQAVSLFVSTWEERRTDKQKKKEQQGWKNLLDPGQLQT
jgi:hypothetical protein